MVVFPAENSLLRFASEDKTPGEDFLLGRSLSQNRRKAERGASPTHYTLVPALQMEVSTSSSDSASLYHVRLRPFKKMIVIMMIIMKHHSFDLCTGRNISHTILRCACRCLSDRRCCPGPRRRAKVSLEVGSNKVQTLCYCT